jgi:hypothetical protein
MYPNEKQPLRTGPTESDLPPELKALEAALASLVPAERLDRHRLMFEAGRRAEASNRARRRWAWPALSTALAAMAATLAVMLAARPEPQVVVRTIRVGAEEQSGPSEQKLQIARDTQLSQRAMPPRDTWPAHDSYAELRDRVLSLGIEAWQPARVATGSATIRSDEPVTYGELYDELVGERFSLAEADRDHSADGGDLLFFYRRMPGRGG